MIQGTPSLAEVDRDPIKFTCPRCNRSGKYSKATLLARFGPDVMMPDLLPMVARWRGCKHVISDPYDPSYLAGDKCRIHYVRDDLA
jgi:hypothetical protein